MQKDNKIIKIGDFDSFEDAALAQEKAKKSLHGEYARNVDRADESLNIVARSICAFNVSIDIDGRFFTQASTEICDKPCDYCRLAAEYICDQLKKGKSDVFQ